MKYPFWRQPHPFIFNTASIAIPGLLTFVVVFLLAPFHFSELPFFNRFIQALMSSAIACACIGMAVLATRKFFPLWSKHERWTIGKEIILILSVVVLIAVVHFGLLSFQADNEVGIYLFQKVVLRTVVISIFPIIGLVLFEQHSHRTKQLKRVLKLNKIVRGYHLENLSRANNSQPEQDLVWFYGENGKPICQLDPFSIQFIKADGNYFEIYYLTNGLESKKQLVRNKLAEAEKSLPYPFFWRVHRSFLVNFQQVESVSGNARDLELVMKETGERIPVSRTKASRILKELPDLSHSSQMPPDHTK